MGSIEHRLGRLERLAESPHEEKRGGSTRSMERFLHALENARREIEGREPLPELPYTEEDRQDDEEFLRETLPFYRASLGWQTEEARHVLDIWERDTIERLGKGA
jgi:hypothetical protein